jgi:hypothetical protein
VWQYVAHLAGLTSATEQGTTAMTMKWLDLTVEEERARHALDLLKRLTGMSDADLGAALNHKHQAIAQRRTGYTRIHPHRDVPKLAEALGVDPACFEMTGAELLDWVRDRRPDLLECSTRWMRFFDVVASLTRRSGSATCVAR